MFYILANNLALDLINTKVVDGDGNEVELLNNSGDLLDWAVVTGILTRKQAAQAKREWVHDDGESLISRALDFRRELKLMAEALTKGKPVPRSSVDRINEILKLKSGFFEVRADGKGYEKEFRPDLDDSVDILLAIAESAADLLCYGVPSHVKKCERETCVLYFYDTSKRHGRRWCSMAGCGNRAKANAFYERKKLSITS